MHYFNSAIKFPVHTGLGDLPECIEIGQIAEIDSNKYIILAIPQSE
jgi:hypothetical protein